MKEVKVAAMVEEVEEVEEVEVAAMVDEGEQYLRKEQWNKKLK